MSLYMNKNQIYSLKEFIKELGSYTGRDGGDNTCASSAPLKPNEQHKFDSCSVKPSQSYLRKVYTAFQIKCSPN